LSEEGGFGIGLAEKFLGLIILAAGAFSMYYVLTSVQELGNAAGLLAFLNLILIVLGLVLLTAKTE
jgi:hypothetical protein